MEKDRYLEKINHGQEGGERQRKKQNKAKKPIRVGKENVEVTEHIRSSRWGPHDQKRNIEVVF